MAGLIRKDDIEAVRNALKIDEIIGEHVTLRPAGVGSLKGLCPFHDERTPSFNVRPHLGMFHCFGCGESGDVISFVQKIDHLPFTEAVEILAAKAGITLHYEEGGARVRTEEPGKRQRLLDAHRVAEEFYQAQLATPDAHRGRQFLADRGFTQAMCAHFGVGYAPASWDALTRHLRSKGFTDQEIQVAGLGSQGSRGIYDRFRGRLVWPIRDITGATVGFGARRLDETEKDSPKYLNTPETPIYKKSQLLYGLDLAKKSIATDHRVVIVEGYTDVMAAHVAGVTNAVATCGTAFGSEHVRVIRRLLGDHADPAAGVVLSSGRAHGSEVIFTFDGDSAGRKAALRAYGEDQNFAAQTFVAVAPGGQDPCELRLSAGDQAVIDLVDSRIPLFEFAIRSVLSQMDLRSAEGRVAGLRASAGIVAHIKDRALRTEYTRALAGWLGMDTRTVEQAIRAAARAQVSEREARPGTVEMAGAGRPGPVPERRGNEDPVSRVERQALEAVLQNPLAVVGSGFEELDGQSFTVPTHRAVHDVIRAAGGLDAFTQMMRQAEAHFGPGEDATRAASRHFVQVVLETAGEFLAPEVTELAVAPLPVAGEADLRSYCRGVVAAMVRMDLTRKLGEARANLARMSEEDPQYSEIFRSLMRLEQRRQNYTERH